MLLKAVVQGGTTKDKSSFDLANLWITTTLRHYTSLSKKKKKSRPVLNHKATRDRKQFKDMFYPNLT